MKKKKLLCVCIFVCSTFAALQAQRTISGTVTNAENKEGLPGVSVIVKGSVPPIGTITDNDGRYLIDVPANSTLVFSHLGRENIELPIEGTSKFDIEMNSLAVGLDAVVVTGFGNVSKASYTGSAEVVSGNIITKTQTANVTKSIEGLVPGVQVTGNSGQPGSGMNIRIRGIGSVNASNEPLYIVDGSPYDGSISSFNPEDIENISVLKDAASAALYGARGANGVVLITTKQGRSQKPIFNFKATFGVITRGIPEYDRVNQKEYYELWWTALRNKYIEEGYSKSDAGYKASGLTDNGSGGVIDHLGGYNSYNVANDQLLNPLTGKLNPNA